MIRVFLSGIGMRGPGLAGWVASQPVLRGELPYYPSDIGPLLPTILHERERRRTSMTVRLALAVAKEALDSSGVSANDLPAVFGSANGDGDTAVSLLKAVNERGGAVSPTQFHNSVHNASVGYWSIGTQTQAACTSIAAHDATFAATILKGAAQVQVERRSVLLAVFDCPYPAPFDAVRSMIAPFGVAFVLSPAAMANTLAELTMDWAAQPARAHSLTDPGLARLADGNPAARALPLLQAVANRTTVELDLALPAGGCLSIALRC